MFWEVKKTRRDCSKVFFVNGGMVNKFKNLEKILPREHTESTKKKRNGTLIRETIRLVFTDKRFFRLEIQRRNCRSRDSC